MKTIEDLENVFGNSLDKLRSSQLFEGLDELLPAGYEIQVTLRDKSHHEKRRDASADNWNPSDGEILITFHAPEARQDTGNAHASVESPQSAPDFSPVPIRGPGLSETILAERR